MRTNLWDKLAGGYDKNTEKKYSDANLKTLNASFGYCTAENRVLDFGCGTGVFTLEMAEKVKEVAALDTSAKMLEIARSKADASNIGNIKWLQSSVLDVDFVPETFDIVTAFNILLYLPNKEDCLIKLRELLKPGGVFISVTDCLGEKAPFHNKAALLLSRLGLFPYIEAFTTDGLRTFIESSGFEIVFSENVYTSPPNYFVAARKT